MKGLLLKDFYVIRESLLMLILTFIAVGAGLAILISPWVLIIIAATTLSLQAVTTIQNDKSTQWNRFSATLPISRTQVVRSKYLSYILLCITGILLGIIVSIVASIFKQEFDVYNMFSYSCLAIIVSLLPGGISIPCAFLFDEEKSILGLILSYIVTSCVLVALVILLKQVINIRANLPEICGIAALFSIITFIASALFFPQKLSLKDI